MCDKFLKVQNVPCFKVLNKKITAEKLHKNRGAAFAASPRFFMVKL